MLPVASSATRFGVLTSFEVNKGEAAVNGEEINFGFTSTKEATGLFNALMRAKEKGDLPDGLVGSSYNNVVTISRKAISNNTEVCLTFLTWLGSLIGAPVTLGQKLNLPAAD